MKHILFRSLLRGNPIFKLSFFHEFVLNYKKSIFLLVIFFFPAISWSNPWVIIANGTPLPTDELTCLLKDRKVLVLDGAINRFRSLPFYPDCILGDFDSIEDPAYWGITATFSKINEKSRAYRGNFGIKIIPAKNQDFTDLEKGILYCDRQKASSIFILQATGGRMDHTLGNVGVLRKYYQLGRNLTIVTEKEQIFYLNNETVIIEGGIGEHCAIMGYPQATMTTSGLAYNGNRYPLHLGIQESTCNVIVNSRTTISIQGEALIIVPRTCFFKIIKA